MAKVKVREDRYPVDEIFTNGEFAFHKHVAETKQTLEQTRTGVTFDISEDIAEREIIVTFMADEL